MKGEEEEDGVPYELFGKRRVCGGCKTSITPRWRRGPKGRQTLCNSCGLKFIRKVKREKMRR